MIKARWIETKLVDWNPDHYDHNNPTCKYPRNEKEEWTEWYVDDIIEDEYPTYIPMYRHGTGNAFKNPLVSEYKPVKNSTTVFKRKRIRSWTDEYTGDRWAQVIDVETDYRR